MDITIQVGNIFDFLKNNSGIKVMKIPARQIAKKYLFEDVYQDTDIEYMPKEFLLSLFIEFLYISAYEFKDRNSRLVVNGQVIDSWYKKCDNLISLIKKNGITINFNNSDIRVTIESVYENLQYQPLFDLIIEGYSNKNWNNQYDDTRDRLANYNPDIFKKLAVLGIIPPPYNQKEQRLYQQATHSAIVDMSIGLRGSGLPSLVLENIANQAYNPTGMDVYSLVKNITERK